MTVKTQLLPFAHQLADAAGAVIRPYSGQTLDVETKADASPVSRADREAEQAIRALIAEHFPDHAIYGEEYENILTTHDSPLTTRYTWVIDPIDGTRAFLAGKKEWGTLIALCENGVPMLGILDQPVSGERWVGVKGEPSTFDSPLAGKSKPASAAPQVLVRCQSAAPRSPHGTHVANAPAFPLSRKGRAAKTRACPSLNAATISTTSRNYFTPPQAGAFVTLAKQCGEVVENGDCYAYGLLARGERDLVVDAGLKPYDILALVPIIEGAGGVITGWDGAPITLAHFSTALAAGDAARHKEALAILSQSL